ncbi:MAG: hypothetical protein LQ339_000454 [Xanthoria mediterranea]|nr:MAG: hypothetical protein LQ339_000454 [Xanthoria mediterranea]
MDFFRLRMRLFEHFRFGDRIQHLLGPSERTGKVNGHSKQLGAVMVLHPGPMSVYGLCFLEPTNEPIKTFGVDDFIRPPSSAWLLKGNSGASALLSMQALMQLPQLNILPAAQTHHTRERQVRIKPYGTRDRILFGFQAAVAHAWLPMEPMPWLGPQTGLPTSRGA